MTMHVDHGRQHTHPLAQNATGQNLFGVGQLVLRGFYREKKRVCAEWNGIFLVFLNAAYYICARASIKRPVLL
jgi:hypothetical protein